MLTVPWDTTSAGIVYALCSIGMVSFFVVLYKIHGVQDTQLFRNLSVALIISQLMYILETIFSFKVTRELEKDPNQYTKSVKVNNALCFTTLATYYVMYCSAHWIFAIKYWIISYKIAGGKRLQLVQAFYIFILVLNVCIPVFFGYEAGADAKNFDLSYQMLIMIQVFSCLVQFDACRRFYVFIEKNTATGINIKMVCFHVFVYFLYIAGLLYFYFTFILENSSETKKAYTVSIVIKNGLECLSLIALAYLFITLCQPETEVRSKSETKNRLSLIQQVEEQDRGTLFKSVVTQDGDLQNSSKNFITADDFDNEEMNNQERYLQRCILNNLIQRQQFQPQSRPSLTADDGIIKIENF